MSGVGSRVNYDSDGPVISDPAGKQAQKPRVLVVEDDPDLIEAMSNWLSRTCMVTVATDVTVAIRETEQQAFDLILLDLILPTGTGMDLLAELARKAEAPPVLVMSALGSTVDLSPFKALVIGLLPKPFGLNQMDHQVREALAGRRQVTPPARAQRASILLVDDDAAFLEGVTDYLRLQGYSVTAEQSLAGACQALERLRFDAVVTDWIMPGGTGLDLVRRLRVVAPTVPVILLTGFATPDLTREALRKGAADVLVKPFLPQALPVALEKCLHQTNSLVVVPSTSKGADRAEAGSGLARPRRYALDDIVGSSPALRRARQALARIASLDSSVLILGETGTGKELFAQALHDISSRSKGPFVAINVAAIPESLLESELFGYASGAFTGARKDGHRGKFLQADGGTLLLDEIGDLPLSAQVKLLRVLQEGEVDLIGGGSKRTDVRVVAATHRDLEQMVAQGTFRSDLFYRLNVMTLQLPPLRERLDDVSGLAEQFLTGLRERYGRAEMTFSAEAMALLTGYSWPGNIRELRNAVERAFAYCQGDLILPVDLPENIQRAEVTARPSVLTRGANTDGALGMLSAMTDLAGRERQAILDALDAAKGNKVQAAKYLGISRAGLYIKLRVYGIM